jgi:predicted nucleic acid-binding Zn finger protein
MHSMHEQIETQEQQERTLARATEIVESKRIRKHQNNIFCVQSANEKTPNNFHVVTYDTALDALMCSCKAFEYSKDGTCKHILSIAIAKQRGLIN